VIKNKICKVKVEYGLCLGKHWHRWPYGYNTSL